MSKMDWVNQSSWMSTKDGTSSNTIATVEVTNRGWEKIWPNGRREVLVSRRGSIPVPIVDSKSDKSNENEVLMTKKKSTKKGSAPVIVEHPAIEDSLA